jgi:hypothetical protein
LRASEEEEEEEASERFSAAMRSSPKSEARGVDGALKTCRCQGGNKGQIG